MNATHLQFYRVMKKLKLLTTFFLLLTFTAYLGQVTSTEAGEKSSGSETGSADNRMDDVVFPINGITHDDTNSPWTTTACVNDPNDLFAGTYTGHPPFPPTFDVHDLREIPYAESPNAPNPDINNHTFWFKFGCCGEVFCVDDLDDTHTFTDQAGFGNLQCTNVDVGWDTSIWVNFMTQCENCTMDFTGQGEGSWYKWEMDYEANELLGMDDWDSLYDELSHVVDVGFQNFAPCIQDAQYGCQSFELSE